MSKQRLELVFKGNVVATVGYVNEETEKFADEMLADATVEKSRSWCG